jgi:glycosyltransferase involved in cell wall biosynthesis
MANFQTNFLQMIQEQLFFSIIIPTYNRPDRLQTCLNSLTRLNYPRDRFEVIVVDDGSAKPLESVVLPFKEKLNLQLIRQDNSGPAAARNTGATKARGKFLVFTDDDCQSDRNWLKAIETSFQENPDCLLGGHTINQLTDNLYSEASQLLVDYLYTYYNSDPKQASFFTSNNFALSAELFREIGYFDTTFPLAAGEDREVCDRWLHCGYPMVYVPDALIYHSHNLKLSSFWRQHFNYGRGAFHFHQVRAKRNAAPMKVEPSTFYFDLLRYPFSVSTQHSKIFLTSLFFVSQVANVTGFFWQRTNSVVNN